MLESPYEATASIIEAVLVLLPGEHGYYEHACLFVVSTCQSMCYDLLISVRLYTNEPSRHVAALL